MSERLPIPAVEIAFRTDPGRDPDKQVNEDSAVHAETPLGLLCVVCDGMGGHAGGKEASELAVKTIVELIAAAPPVTKPRDALRVALEEANRRIWSMPTAEAGHRPGSTVVAILAHEGGADVAHVGDSRIYLIHAGAISQITRDHSMVQEMVSRNLIRAEDAANHPDANKILRALGIAKDVEVELRPEPVPYVAGDVFVLCSDGLSDLVGAAEILDVAGSRPAAQAAGQLVDLANARGGHDNITAMCVRMKASASKAETQTVVKTMQLTVPDGAQPPSDPTAGPRGTILAMPARPESDRSGGSYGGPVSPHGPQAHIPAHVPSHPKIEQDEHHHGSRLPVVVGVVLSVVALLIAGVFVFINERPRKHVNVVAEPFDASATRDAAVAEPEDESPAPEITAAPPLGGSPSAWWKDPDASPPNGEPRACAKARWAKGAGKPASEVHALEAECRAAGGTP